MSTLESGKVLPANLKLPTHWPPSESTWYLFIGKQHEPIPPPLYFGVVGLHFITLAPLFAVKFYASCRWGGVILWLIEEADGNWSHNISCSRKGTVIDYMTFPTGISKRQLITWHFSQQEGDINWWHFLQQEGDSNWLHEISYRNRQMVIWKHDISCERQ